MKYVQFSEKGPRMNNEDSLGIVEIADKRTLFVVCDGMGGHSCGEIASKTVCDSFTSYWQNNPYILDSVQKIEEAATEACWAIDEKSGHYQMGTTLVMASIEGRTAYVAHAGDSRCYIIDIKGNIKYRTIDHIESSSISLPYINRAFFTRHPEEAVPDLDGGDPDRGVVRGPDEPVAAVVGPDRGGHLRIRRCLLFRLCAERRRISCDRPDDDPDCRKCGGRLRVSCGFLYLHADPLYDRLVRCDQVDRQGEDLPDMEAAGGSMRVRACADHFV